MCKCQLTIREMLLSAIPRHVSVMSGLGVEDGVGYERWKVTPKKVWMSLRVAVE